MLPSLVSVERDQKQVKLLELYSSTCSLVHCILSGMHWQRLKLVLDVGTGMLDVCHFWLSGIDWIWAPRRGVSDMLRSRGCLRVEGQGHVEGPVGWAFQRFKASGRPV